MSLSVKWEQKLLHNELHRTAFSLANEFHDSFGKVSYATTSYFRSLAERLPEFLKDGFGQISGKWGEESSRGSVASYWQAEDKDGQTLLSKITTLFAEIIPGRIRGIMRKYKLEIVESSQEYNAIFHKLASYIFRFIADFIVLEDKKNDRDQE